VYSLGVNRLGTTNTRTNTITSLFTNGEKGAWYDPSDLSTLFQNSNGTTAVAVGDVVGYIADKSGNGNHALQSDADQRPLLAVDSSGNHYLDFDGLNDGMVIANLEETSPTPIVGFFGYKNNEQAGDKYLLDIATGRTVFAAYSENLTPFGISVYMGGWKTSYLQPEPLALKVVTFQAATNDISIREDGITVAANEGTTAQKAVDGNIKLFSHNNNTGNAVDGHLYQAVVRLATCTVAEIATTEAFIAQKTGILAQVAGIATLDLDFSTNTYTARDINGTPS
jgi:hypothetical protein